MRKRERFGAGHIRRSTGSWFLLSWATRVEEATGSVVLLLHLWIIHAYDFLSMKIVEKQRQVKSQRLVCPSPYHTNSHSPFTIIFTSNYISAPQSSNLFPLSCIYFLIVQLKKAQFSYFCVGRIWCNKHGAVTLCSIIKTLLIFWVSGI